MKLTRNEINTLIDYHEKLVSDFDNYMYYLEKDCICLLDYDLYKIQRARYKQKIDENKARISELQTELDEL